MPPKISAPPTLPPLKLARQWVHLNLFSTWYNSLLTIVCVWALLQLGMGLWSWVTTQAQWAVVPTNLRLFWVGRFPVSQLWRLWGIGAIVLATVSVTWGVFQGFNRGWMGRVALIGLGVMGMMGLLQVGTAPLLWILGMGVGMIVSLWCGHWLRTRTVGQRWVRGLPVLWFVTAFLVLWLLGGGGGLTPVSTSLWNGLLLTLLMAIVSIVLSFPLGILLALGRRSDLPVIRTLCILYIEIIRGLPLIGILFMAQLMLPLVLPPQIQLDAVVRGIAGLTFFSAAYLAENVRGGLQAIPKGQIEAAQALGLHPTLVLGLIVLPQALRAVVPAIVGQLIGLFKDTSLLSLVGLVELTGMARSIVAQPQFIGRYAEVYLFIGLLYWLFCYLMSLGSRRLEQQLGP